MNKVLVRVLWAACALLALSSAQAQESRTHSLGPFDRVFVHGLARLELSQGDRDHVVVIGDEAAQRGVRLSVSNGRLTVHTEDEWKFWSRDGVQVKVQLRDLSHLALAGAGVVDMPRPMKLDVLRVSIAGQGTVRIHELVARQLSFSIAGAGEGEVAGRVDELAVRVAGKGKVSAQRLQAQRAMVSMSGIGHADVWATEDLKVSVSGVANVNYWGNPRVQRSGSGLAEVTARGDRSH